MWQFTDKKSRSHTASFAIFTRKQRICDCICTREGRQVIFTALHPPTPTPSPSPTPGRFAWRKRWCLRLRAFRQRLAQALALAPSPVRFAYASSHVRPANGALSVCLWVRECLRILNNNKQYCLCSTPPNETQECAILTACSRRLSTFQVSNLLSFSPS